MPATGMAIARKSATREEGRGRPGAAHLVSRKLYPASTKLKPPPIARRCVIRSRLMARLDEAVERRLTLVSAPAGAGKTSLAAQWVRERRQPSAWLVLDSGDSDLGRFVPHFAAALETAVSGSWPGDLETLEATRQTPDGLADSVAGSLEDEGPIVLVLDDYQTVDSREVDQFLTRLVQYAPESLRLVVLTRTDPNWPLAQWRERQWMTDLGPTDLQFLVDETNALIRLSGGPRTADFASQLYGLTEGWVGILQLIVQQSSDDHLKSDYQPAQDPFVDAYLEDEILSGLSNEVRDFMVWSSLPDRFSAPLCDFMLSDGSGTDSRRFLETLARQNLLLTAPARGDGRWYRYNSLLRKWLAGRVEDQMRDCLPLFHRRAADWFASRSLVDEAIHHYLAAGEQGTAVELVSSVLREGSGRNLSPETVSRWLSELPNELIDEQPWLLVADAWRTASRWQVDRVAPMLDRAESLLLENAADIDDAECLRGYISTLRGVSLYWTGDPESALAFSQQAQDLLSERIGYPRNLALGTAAGAWAEVRDRNTAYAALEVALSDDCRSGSCNSGPLLLMEAILRHFDGDLDAVEWCACRLADYQFAGAIGDEWLAQSHYFQGVVAYERNLLDEASSHLEAVESAGTERDPRLYHESLMGLALLSRARGDRAEARRYAEKARRVAVQAQDPVSLAISGSMEARLGMGPPLSLTHPGAGVPIGNGQNFWFELAPLTLAECLLRSSESEVQSDALTIADEGLADARRCQNRRQEIQFLAVRALALEALRRREEALASTRAAVDLARPLGYVRTFLDRGPAMKRLLRALADEESVDSGYVQSLLGAFAGVRPPTSSPGPITPGNDGDLTNREMDVLEMLARRMRNKEIATHLFISPETVKKHTVSIYRKLNAHHRREAVRTATKMGLLLNRHGISEVRAV